MPGRKPKLPKGFISAEQVAAAARARGFDVKPGTVSSYSNQGKLPFGQAVPGRTKGRMFAEANLDAIIMAIPKKSARPAGMLTVTAMTKLAKAQGLTVSPEDVRAKINKAIRAAETGGEKRRHPGREFVGLQTDFYDSHHRLFIPRALAEELLLEAKRRKELPQLLASGELVPLSRVATDLGLGPMSLHGRKDIGTERIGNGRYVARSEAARFKRQYVLGKEMGAGRKGKSEPIRELVKRAGQAGASGKKAVAKARKAGGKRKKPAEEKAGLVEKPVRMEHLTERQLNEQTGRRWMQENAGSASPELRKRLEGIINANADLPPGDFNQLVLYSLGRNLREGLGQNK